MLDLELGLGLCFAEPFDDDFGPGPAAHGPPETGAEAEEVPEHCGETGCGFAGEGEKVAVFAELKTQLWL